MFYSSHNSKFNNQEAFTIVEVAMVILVMGLAYAFLIPRLPNSQYWREEDMIRRLSETIIFLHRQAVNDGCFYKLEFSLDGKLEGCNSKSCYRVGEIIPEKVDYTESEIDKTSSFKTNLSEKLDSLYTMNTQGGFLTDELSDYKNPSLGDFQNVQEPENFPSLWKPTIFEEETYMQGIRTMRGVFEINDGASERPYIIFSPRGFSEFAVIHIQLSNENNKVTILVNPFTGLTDIYRGDSYKDFEWTYN